ncbi:hypothetical protein [Shewanella algae]|uniref:hypothetical protein n=1 Tax=Shewanella algae TaxID=38313 RepID=UPI001AAEF96B|nr:hypothetical protein [Shewanella algae]MBO2589508.1 hypothetical protein [Shewanella algae]
MKVIPINFNTEMMSAILEGRKTQTRRPVKLKNVDLIEFMGGSDEENASFDFVGLRHGEWESDDGTVWGPEWLVYCTEYPEEGVVPVGSLYGAIGDQLLATDGERNTTIEITGFRVERVQDINKEDAKAEGCDYPAVPGMGWKLGARHNFMRLWDSIYSNWNDNPWVWVIEFKVTNGVIGEEAA